MSLRPSASTAGARALIISRRPRGPATGRLTAGPAIRASRVAVVRRQLRYPKAWPAEPAQEKGIDVALAVDLVRLACEGAYDVGVLFSRDTDLVPALETVKDLGRHVEGASWKGTSRLRFPDSQLPWCHYLDADDYAGCRDHTDYTAA
ncbi:MULTISPECIES: NYN domain-containing protein [Pseudofrankia]|uniref:NYN domain-containing protein n=1 Tax=Pseudofrankia TaxID=2994363 RepID=UPI001E45489A|nr:MULTISPECIES: NYN domain-containing protein [Pseudofrankia]